MTVYMLGLKSLDRMPAIGRAWYRRVSAQIAPPKPVHDLATDWVRAKKKPTVVRQWA